MPVLTTEDEQRWLAELRVLVRRRRRALSLTQDELATRAGLSLDMISRIERGTRVPGLAVCRRLASGLETTIPALLPPDGNGAPAAAPSPAKRGRPAAAPAGGQVPVLSGLKAMRTAGSASGATGHVLFNAAEGDDCFAFRVEDDSMSGAGFIEGDLVVLRRERSAEDGDLVLAAVDGRALLRRLRSAGNLILLQPENHRYDAVGASVADTEILGVVVAMQRSFGPDAAR